MSTKLVDQAVLLQRAERQLSVKPRPFLRWAGSKRFLLPTLVPLLPTRYGRYFEPFLGGGSLFFALQPDRAVLGDSCHELIRTYQAVGENGRAVARHLAPLKPDKDLFYKIRSRLSGGRFKRAAQFIYLNKTCWNGLYRVNASGQFNVPYGSPKSDNVFDRLNLLSCSQVLCKPGIELVAQDFEETVRHAKAGDLVFFDPPYVTGHNNNGFIDYNEILFSWEDQERLAEVAEVLRGRGVNVLVSNADHEAIKGLYPHFSCTRVERRSTIASKSSKRGRITESVFWSRS